MTRLRCWLLLLLIVHVLVHPIVHAMINSSTVAQTSTLTSPGDRTTASKSLDDCSLCRAGRGSMLWADLGQIALLNPLWIPIRLHTVSHALLGFQHQLPSRAPPSF